MNYKNNSNPFPGNKPFRPGGVFLPQGNFPSQSVPKQQYFHNNNNPQAQSQNPQPRFSSFTPGPGNFNRLNNNENSTPSRPFNNLLNRNINQTDMSGKPRQRFLPITPGRMESENFQQNDVRNLLDPFQKFKCNTHNRAPLTKICTHIECINNTLMCEACALNHKPDHRDWIFSVEGFFEEAEKVFQRHQEEISEHKIIPNDLLGFIKNEGNAVSRYEEHITMQKEVVENQFKCLLDCFKEMCDVKMEEFKKFLDSQLQVFSKNYNYFSQKVKNFYEYACIDVISEEKYQNKDSLLAHWKNLQNFSESNNFLKDIKALFCGANSLHNQILTEGQIPKKAIEDEINNEIRKYIQRIHQQLTFPISLEDTNKTQGLCFMDAYNSLAKKIEKAFENFHASLADMPINEDLTKMSFFSLLEENAFFQPSAPQYEKQSRTSKTTTKSVFTKGNFYVKYPSLISIDGYGITEKKENSQPDLEVDADNFYDFNAIYKILHYFEPSSNNLHVFDLKTLPTTQGGKFENLDDINIIQVSLDISFSIPYNICSITTPDGRLFLCGGSDEGETYNYHYEYNPKDDSLVRRRPMLNKRCNHGVCMLGRDKIMVAGGFSAEQGYLNTCEVYHVKKDMWTYVSPLNKKSECHSLCNFNEEYVYKLGGKNDYVIERYNIKSNIWEVILLDRDVEVGHSCESVQINSNQIIIFGGYYQGNLDQCSVLTVKNEENVTQETLKKCEDIVLPEKLYFHCPKSALVYGDSVYAIDYGKQKVIRFSNKNWECLN